MTRLALNQSLSHDGPCNIVILGASGDLAQRKLLPALFSGSAIVSVVLSLPTTGPLLLDALKSQDMYLAGSFLLLLSTLTVIGMLLSDILLALVDPRIRFE